MTDNFDPSHATDALARDLAELRDRVTNDPATRVLTTIAAIGAGIGVLGIVITIARTLIRKRRIISNVVLLVTTVAAFMRLRERDVVSLRVQVAEGPPPPPATPTV